MNIKVGDQIAKFEYNVLFENGTYEAIIKNIYIKEDYRGKSKAPIVVVYELSTDDGNYEFEDFLFLENPDRKLEHFLLAAYGGTIPPEPQLEELKGLCGWIELTTEHGNNREYNTAVSWDFSGEEDENE